MCESMCLCFGNLNAINYINRGNSTNLERRGVVNRNSVTSVCFSNLHTIINEDIIVYNRIHFRFHFSLECGQSAGKRREHERAI